LRSNPDITAAIAPLPESDLGAFSGGPKRLEPLALGGISTPESQRILSRLVSGEFVFLSPFFSLSFVPGGSGRLRGGGAVFKLVYGVFGVVTGVDNGVVDAESEGVSVDSFGRGGEVWGEV
jgi:hypothetical protein